MGADGGKERHLSADDAVVLFRFVHFHSNYIVFVCRP